MRSIFILILFLPFIGLATPGYYGTDTKIKAKEGKFFTVEQAGYEMKVDSDKLPQDIQNLWTKNIGKTFESPIPFAAIVGEKKLKNPKGPPIKER